MKTTALPNQIYKTLVYRKWDDGDTWCCLVTSTGYEELLARQYFWEKYGSRIQEELIQWQKSEWEVPEVITADSIKLRVRNYSDLSVNPADVLIWFMTFGIAFIFQLFTHGLTRRYVRYEPIEVRIPMRQCQRQSQNTSAAQQTERFNAATNLEFAEG